MKIVTSKRKVTCFHLYIPARILTMSIRLVEVTRQKKIQKGARGKGE